MRFLDLHARETVHSFIVAVHMTDTNDMPSATIQGGMMQFGRPYVIFVQDFKMVSSRVGSKGGAALCKALACGTALRSFDISDNPMDADIAPHIASVVPKHCDLRRLILSDLGLGDEGVKGVCEALAGAAVCPNLEKIDLALNEITPDSTSSVAAMLAARKATLQQVGLAENELECVGAIHVAAALQGAPKLEVLDLKANGISRVGALAVAKACSQGMGALKVVELDDNRISDEGVDEVWLFSESLCLQWQLSSS